MSDNSFVLFLYLKLNALSDSLFTLNRLFVGDDRSTVSDKIGLYPGVCHWNIYPIILADSSRSYYLIEVWMIRNPFDFLDGRWPWWIMIWLLYSDELGASNQIASSISASRGIYRASINTIEFSISPSSINSSHGAASKVDYGWVSIETVNKMTITIRSWIDNHWEATRWSWQCFNAMESIFINWVIIRKMNWPNARFHESVLDILRRPSSWGCKVARWIAAQRSTPVAKIPALFDSFLTILTPQRFYRLAAKSW